MDINESNEMNEMYLLIGHAVSCLLESGREVDSENILSLLKQTEEKATDERRRLCRDTIMLFGS